MAKGGNLPESEFGGDYGLVQGREHVGMETAAEKRMLVFMQPTEREELQFGDPDYQDELAKHDLDRYRGALPKL